MSEQISNTPETPKSSKLAQKLNSLKPSVMDDEKTTAVVGRIKMIGAFVAGSAATLAVVIAASVYNSSKLADEYAEVEETEETTED